MQLITAWENNKWQERRQSSWNNNKNYLWKERHAETFIQPLWRTILVNYSIFIDYLLYWVSYVGMWSCFPEHAGCFGKHQQDTGGNQLILSSPITNSILSLAFLLSISNTQYNSHYEYSPSWLWERPFNKSNLVWKFVVK